LARNPLYPFALLIGGVSPGLQGGCGGKRQAFRVPTQLYLSCLTAKQSDQGHENGDIGNAENHAHGGAMQIGPPLERFGRFLPSLCEGPLLGAASLLIMSAALCFLLAVKAWQVCDLRS